MKTETKWQIKFLDRGMGIVMTDIVFMESRSAAIAHTATKGKVLDVKKTVLPIV